MSSESVDRQVRRDPCSSEISEEQLLTKPTKIPKPSKKDHHKQVRGDPYDSEIPEWLQEFGENLVDDRVPEHRESHASSSHESSLEPTWIWVSTVFIFISLKTEIARSARGPKLQGLRAEDVLAESYFVQKIWVILLQQITKFSVKVVNLETIIDMQSWCKTWPPNGSSRIRAKKKNFSENTKELAKVLGARQET